MNGLKGKLYSRVAVDGECILWMGAKTGAGYGAVCFGGDDSILTHRAAWKCHFGEIPDGLCVCHKCDVRNCINPQHLFLGTKADNNKDKGDKGRAPHGDMHYARLEPHRLARGSRHGSKTRPDRILRGDLSPCAKLTSGDVENIRQACLFLSQTELARIYGVTQAAVSLIVLRKTWA